MFESYLYSVKFLDLIVCPLFFFSFVHRIVCHSSVNGFRLSLWHLQTFLIHIQFRGRECMVVGYITTYAISPYHHYRILIRRGVLDAKLCDKVCQ